MCFNRIFPTEDGRIRAEDAAIWQWKFLDNPVDRIQIVVAEHVDEGIVGAYPCQPLRVWLDGEARWCSQIVDLMVEPKHRRYPPRPGLFVHLGKEFYNLYCGVGEEQQIFNYGWPVPAWRMGQRYLDYLNVRDWNLLYREFVEPGKFQPNPEGLSVTEVRRFGPDVEPLFDEVKQRCGVTLIKNEAYLNWRYADCPHKKYRLFEVREDGGGALRAIGVYRLGDFIRPNTGFVVDCLLRDDDRDAMVALINRMEETAAADGSPVLVGVWNPIDPRFRLLQSMGFWLLDSGYFVVASTFRHDTTFFRDNWIYTMGDSDLI